MGEAFIVRKGGVTSEATAAPTITIISETATDVTFTLTNNDDNTAVIVYEIDTTQDFVELAAAAVSANITVALAVGTYTLTAFATVVGEVATQSSETVVIEVIIPEYEELFSTTVATNTTQIDITGLNIGKDDTLRLVYTFVSDATPTVQICKLYVNNNITDSNYTEQSLVGSGGTISAGRLSRPFLTLFRLGDSAAGFADIKVSNNNQFVFQTQNVYEIGAGSSAIENWNTNVVGNFTTTSISTLSLIASQTNAIGIGSKIALYKVTEAA